MVLRYAVLINNDGPPSWAYAFLKNLSLGQDLKFVGYLKTPQGRSKQTPRPLRDEGNYEFRLGNDFAESPCEIIHTIRQENIEAELKTFRLDFVINFCKVSETVHGDVSAAVRFGIWRFQFGSTNDPSEIGIDEIFYRKKIQTALLVTDLASSETLVLKSGKFKVRRHSMQFHQTCILNECKTWILSAANELSKRGYLNARSAYGSDLRQGKIPYHRRFIVQILEPVRLLRHNLRRFASQFFFQRWNVGIISQSIDRALTANFSRDVNWWTSNERLTSYADPFPIIYKNELFVMAESFGALSNEGKIQSFCTGPSGTWSAREAIRFPHHLSYPCVVHVNDGIFATFESLDSSELAIYRCARFPDLWTRHAVVVQDQRYADPTLFRHEDRWWLLATEYDFASEGNSNLHAWFSEKGLEGPWVAHLQNPVKSDVGSARSAGSPFLKDGVLHRPSQNCTNRYGQSIVINRIERLNPEEFQEMTIQQIFPTRAYPNGIHHFAGAGSWTAVDGRRDEFSLKLGFRRILKKIRINKKSLSNSKRVCQKPSMKLVLARGTVTGKLLS